MSEFVVELLSPARVMEVYPLIRQIAPGVTLKAWQRHATFILRSRGGLRGMILVRRKTQRFPCGLCSYRQDQDLRLGKILTAEDAVVMTTWGAREAYDALVRGVEQIATMNDCHAVRWLLLHAPADIIEVQRGATVWTPVFRPVVTPSLTAPARP